MVYLLVIPSSLLFGFENSEQNKKSCFPNRESECCIALPDGKAMGCK